MATTTNYGWTTPDDTALVKDGASAIRTLGTSIDTTTKNLNPETTLGDIAYRSSTSNVKTRLGIGSNGQVLTVSGGVPTWAASTSGKVLQVVQGTYATATTIATNTYTDTGLSLSITPTSATSKILVMINQAFVFSRSATSQGASIQILRGATSVFASGADDTWYLVAGTDGTSINLGTIGSLVYLDSPATTSATTYKTQGRSLRTTLSAQVVFQPDSNKTSVITLMEIGA